MIYKTLLVEEAAGVLSATLNRPEVHNAFDEELIAEAIDLFGGIGARDARAVVLRGSGPNFCAGADLNWMSRMVSYTRDENVRDSSLLAKMFALMNAKFAAVYARLDAIDKRFDDMRDLWRAELRRVEEVLDARWKHLESR